MVLLDVNWVMSYILFMSKVIFIFLMYSIIRKWKIPIMISISIDEAISY